MEILGIFSSVRGLVASVWSMGPELGVIYHGWISLFDCKRLASNLAILMELSEEDVCNHHPSLALVAHTNPACMQGPSYTTQPVWGNHAVRLESHLHIPHNEEEGYCSGCLTPAHINSYRTPWHLCFYNYGILFHLNQMKSKVAHSSDTVFSTLMASSYNHLQHYSLCKLDPMVNDLIKTIICKMTFKSWYTHPFKTETICIIFLLALLIF